jgi:hypothetical protein
MNDKRVVLLIILAMVVSVATSGFVLYQRINSEKADNTVELTADFSDIERLSTIENIPVKKLLSELKDAGITSIGLSERLAESVDLNLMAGIDQKKTNLYVPGKGLQSGSVRLIQGAGLRVVPRIRNLFNADALSLSAKIKTFSDFDSVIFADDEVLGYPNHLTGTAAALKEKGIKFGYIEFAKQYGDDALAAKMGGNMMKVHSIGPDELEKMSQTEAIDRFARAVRERSVRMLYIHLLQYPDADKDIAATNAAFINDLSRALRSYGFNIGKASNPPAISVSRLEKTMISFGVAGGTILLAFYFIPINLGVSVLLFILFALLPAKLLALAAAVVLPSYALVSLFPVKKDPLLSGIISGPVLITMYAAAISALGAVFIAALLADRINMLGMDAFSGVKLALVLPLIIVTAYFFFRKDNKDVLDLKAAVSKAMKVLNADIKVYHAVLFIIAASCAALFLLRSGNFGLPVSGLEKHARGLLENILSVRPRTKEFLIGYPAIVLAAVYYMKGGRSWLWAFLAFGVLAPVSMINSFCHIHTPVLVSVTRSCSSLILGIALGLLAYFLFVVYCRAAAMIDRSAK